MIKYELRPYQKDAVQATIEHFKISALPALIVAATGSGKSIIVAALAHYYGTALVLHPAQELVEQNHKKYETFADNGSVYCAGLNKKDLTGDVIFASHQSLASVIEEVPQISILIVDEAHKHIEATKKAYSALQAKYPDILMVGLTATPFMLGAGYIYRIRTDNSVWDKAQAKNPFYSKCVYEISAGYLVEHGYLAPITVGVPLDQYDTSRLEIERGRFTAGSIQKAMRVETTLHIVHQLRKVMEQRDTCMIFASSVDHARTITQMIGKSARMITGDTSKHRRRLYMDMLSRRRIRYLVNVATLTTGVDIPRVDTIAVARPSDSASLFEQIKGRGMRLSHDTGKTDCLLLDYAGNIERFYPAGDIYTPQIQACSDKPEGAVLPVECPTCRYLNQFKAVPNDEGLMLSADGYFMTLDGHKVRDENGQAIPAHYGRRCRGADAEGVQCSYRWVGKRCQRCQTENDIAARKCSCGSRLVDWNKSLTKAASELGVVQLKRGWVGERVQYLKFVETESWIRADLYVKSRKAPLSVFIKSNEARLHMRQNVPYAVAWKRAQEGDKYPAVKVLWNLKDWENQR